MNFSTLGNPEISNVEQINSLRDWWKLAGVDLHYSDEPASLLAENAPIIAPAERVPEEPIVLTESKPSPPHQVPSLKKFSDNYPTQYDEFLAWMSIPENLIEAQWSRNHVLPAGAIDPEIMIITGMPEQADLSQNSVFSPKSNALLANMMKAVGCDSEKIYVAPIAVARSFDGRIGTQYGSALKKRALHLISLVRPKRIIIFGDTASHLFFDENLLTARKNLQFVNHVSSKTEAIATFHPRILNERPEFKAEAWKDLQLLTRIPNI